MTEHSDDCNAVNVDDSLAANGECSRGLDALNTELRLLREVENFALTEYAQALAAGSTLSAERTNEIAVRLSGYTGLPAD